MSFQIICNYVTTCLKGAFGEKKTKRKWGKEIAARPVRGRAHQQLSASLPPPATRDEEGKKKWPSGITDGEKRTRHTSLTKDVHFLRMSCAYRGNSVQSGRALSLPLSEWWKGCSPRENKNGERDRCEFGSQSLHQPRGCRSDTPGTRTHIWKELPMGLMWHPEW